MNFFNKTFVFGFLALIQLLPTYGMSQYMKGLAYKIVPDTYNAGPETLRTIEKLGEDARQSATLVSGTVTTSTQQISQGLVSTTTQIGKTIGESTQALCKAIESTSKSLAGTTELLTKTTEKTSTDLIKSIETINGTATKFIEKGVEITFDPNTTQAVRDLSATVKPLADKGIFISIDPKTTDAISQVAASVKPLAENGVKISLNEATQKNLQDLINNGVQTNFSIDPNTIKTLFIGSVGFALAAAGVAVIYKELTKENRDMQENLTNPNDNSWKQSFKRILKNRYVIGTTGIVSGLLLIAKSNRIAVALG